MPDIAPHGGSWSRDPQTGKLTLIEETLPAGWQRDPKTGELVPIVETPPVQPAPAAAPEAQPPATDAAPADKKTSKPADPVPAATNDGSNSQ